MKKVVSFQQLKPKDVICRVANCSAQVLEFVMVHPRNPEYYVFINQHDPLEFVTLHKSSADFGYYFYTGYCDLIALEIGETEKRLHTLKERYKDYDNERNHGYNCGIKGE